MTGKKQVILLLGYPGEYVLVFHAPYHFISCHFFKDQASTQQQMYKAFTCSEFFFLILKTIKLALSSVAGEGGESEEVMASQEG